MSSPAIECSSVEPPVHRPLVEALDEGRGSFGMKLFIITEATLFAILFAAYYYLGPGSHRWLVEAPPKLHFALPMLAILMISSVVIWWGEEQIKQANFAVGRIALLVTIALGVLFLVLSYFDYSEELRHVTPRTDAYGSIFYTIVSLHVAHLLLGLLMLAWVYFLPRLGPSLHPPHRPFHNASMYWHFVDTVWIIIVLVLFVWPNLVGR